MTISFEDSVTALDANSYSAILEYNLYREGMGYDSRTDEESKVDLIRATAFIESRYLGSWNTNSKVTEGRRLHWPQEDATDASGETLAEDEIPYQVKEAVWQYAIKVEVANQAGLDPVYDSDVKKKSFEGLGSKEFFGRKRSGSLPDSFAFIDQILYGLITSVPGGNRILRIERTC